MGEPYLNTVGIGDNVEYLKRVPDNSIDSCICDPPYGLGKAPDPVMVMTAWAQGKTINVSGGGFMMKEWDAFVPQPDLWKEVLRVLKPGGYLLSFFGSRTYDWGVMAIRFAGFDVVDQLVWHYSTGFPKSLNISKAIDAQLTTGRSDSVGLKHANDNERTGGERVRTVGNMNNGIMSREESGPRIIRDEPATPEGERWDGWGTALKPSQEPITLARKPLTPVPLTAILDEVTSLVEVLLWSMSTAKCVEVVSASNQSDCDEVGFDSVRWIAAVLNTVGSDERSEMTATFSSQEAGSTFSNIATSWNNILDVLCERRSTFTTETTTRLTTALRTLRSSISAITPDTITQAVIQHGGLWSSASDAASNSSDSRRSWNVTQPPFADVSATSKLAHVQGAAVVVLHVLASFADESSLPLQVTRGGSAPSVVRTTQDANSSSMEPIVVARKPFPATFAQNILEHGTGAMNIDGCRVGSSKRVPGGNSSTSSQFEGWTTGSPDGPGKNPSVGRWPPNTLYSHAEGCKLVGTKKIEGTASAKYGTDDGDSSLFGTGKQSSRKPTSVSVDADGKEEVEDWNCEPDCPIAELDRQSGISLPKPGRTGLRGGRPIHGSPTIGTPTEEGTWPADPGGGASRFFPCFRYQAKPSRREREAGLEDFPLKAAKKFNEGGIQGRRDAKAKKAIAAAATPSGRILINEDGTETRVDGDVPQHRANVHPTVKSVELMRWLVRLVTQPGGVVLDPFIGSGTTGVACVLEGFNYVGIEREAEYAEIAVARIKHAGVTAAVERNNRDYFCPVCKDKGEIKMIPGEVIEKARAAGRKITCMKCMKRFTPEELTG